MRKPHDWRNYETCDCGQRGCISSVPLTARCDRCMHLHEIAPSLVEWQLALLHRHFEHGATA